MERVNVVELFDGDEVSDLMLKTSTKNNVKQLIETHENWSFEVFATNGELNCHSNIKSTQLKALKHQSNSKSDDEWELLVFQTLFNELPPNLKSSIQLSGQKSNNGITLNISLVLGPSIKQTLGSVELYNDDDNEDDAKYDLFLWTWTLQKERDTIKVKSDELEQEKQKLELQLAKSLQSQEELVKQLQKKEDHRLAVFNSILNDFQTYNQSIINGEIEDLEDHFNVEYIRRVIQETQLEQEQPTEKKRRVQSKDKKGKDKSQPTKKRTPKASLKRKQVKKEEEDEDDDDIIPDSQPLDEDDTEEKEDESELKASRAQSIPSEKFEFSKKIDDSNDDDKQGNDEKKLEDDKNGANEDKEDNEDNEDNEEEDDEEEEEEEDLEDIEVDGEETDEDTENENSFEEINQDWTDSDDD